jgi:hypothetical protein
MSQETETEAVAIEAEPVAVQSAEAVVIEAEPVAVQSAEATPVEAAVASPVVQTSIKEEEEDEMEFDMEWD